MSIDPGLALPEGTKFSANLELPAFVAAPYGLVLAPITCVDVTCKPSANAYLEPGELLPPGIDPPAIINYITASNKTFANPGLGFEMVFDEVTKDGKVNVDLQDPLEVPDTTEGASAGQRAMVSGATIFQNVGSIIDVSVSSANSSGTMTVTLPYDDGILGGTPEDDLELLHYSNNEWTTVQNIVIDKVNNKISGTVSSLSPFTVGVKTGVISSESTGSSTSSRGPDGGGGGGSSGVISDIDGQKSGYPPLKIMEVSYDTDTNIARIVVGPEYDVMDVVIKTSAGFDIATKVASHPILNLSLIHI